MYKVLAWDGDILVAHYLFENKSEAEKFCNGMQRNGYAASIH